MDIPDFTLPEFQKLAINLGQIGRAHPEVGETDTDKILRNLIGRSLLCLPLLIADRPLMDVGSGVGIPGLILALARPELKVILLEPKVRCHGIIRWLANKFTDLNNLKTLETTLQKVDFDSYPHLQVTSRASLDWSRLLDYLPPASQPIIRWSSPDLPLKNIKIKTYLLRVTVDFQNVCQVFTWAGGEKLFHVKQKEWKKYPDINYEIITVPGDNVA